MTTRFDAVLGANGGDSSRVLVELERSFIEWTRSPDEPDLEAAGRWHDVVVAIAGAGPQAIADEPGLFAGAVTILAIQLDVLPPDAVDASLREALADLATDLVDDGDTAMAGAATILRSAL